MVNKTGLCPVKYYKTDDTHIIKMDYVKGEILEKSISEDPHKYFAMLAQAFRQIHAADPSGTKIPSAEINVFSAQKARPPPVKILEYFAIFFLHFIAQTMHLV